MQVKPHFGVFLHCMTDGPTECTQQEIGTRIAGVTKIERHFGCSFKRLPSIHPYVRGSRISKKKVKSRKFRTFHIYWPQVLTDYFVRQSVTKTICHFGRKLYRIGIGDNRPSGPDTGLSTLTFLEGPVILGGPRAL